MAKWERKTFGEILPSEVTSAITGITDAYSAASPVLQGYSTLSSLASGVSTDYSNFLSTVTKAFIDAALLKVTDFLTSGVFFLPIVPRSTSEYLDWGSVSNIITQSVNDQGDPNRPHFDTSSFIASSIVLFGADNAADAINELRFLSTVYGAYEFKSGLKQFEKLTEITRVARQYRAGQGTPPDWSSFTLARALKLEDVVQEIYNIANLLGGVTTNFFKSADDFIQTRINDLNAIHRLLTGTVNVFINAARSVINSNFSVLNIYPTVKGTILPPKQYTMTEILAAINGAENPPQDRFLIGFMAMAGLPGYSDSERIVNYLIPQVPSVPST